jgi:RNA polymerase sigma-70 factor (ECF subfamily)
MTEQERDDRALGRALARCEIGALETLYDRYAALAFALAYRMLGDRESAEDIVQESFLNVWRHADRYDDQRSSVQSWLLSIVRHRCIDKLRSQSARPQVTRSDDALDLPAASDVWSDVAQRLTHDDIRAALQRLPAEQREAIELAYFGGYTHIEIAERMGIPLGTVKGRLRMGLQKLRQLLAEMEPDVFS